MIDKTITIVGYDSEVSPRIPFEVGRLSGDDDRVVFVHHGADAKKQAMIAPSLDADNPGSKLALAPGTEDVGQVLDEIGEWEYQPGWSVQTRYYNFPWPKGLSLFSTVDAVNWVIELTLQGGDRDEMIYMQGPFARSDAPTPEALVGEGMTEVGWGKVDGVGGEGGWIEMSYQVEGVTWKQRRYFVGFGEEVLLITAQAIDGNDEAIFGTATEIANTIKL